MSKGNAKKTKEWPILIKQGSSIVKIFFTPEKVKDANGKETIRKRYTLAWYEGELRKRLTRSDLAEAKREAGIVAKDLNAGLGAVVQLNGSARDSYLRSVKKLEPLKIDLMSAVEQFVAAQATGAPMVEACRYWVKQHLADLPVKQVDEVYRELLKAKKQDECSERYIGDLKSRLGRFAGDIRMPISEVTTLIIDNWLRGLKLSTRTRNNYRNVIETLFAFAKSRGYLSREVTTAAEHASLARSKLGEIQIFSPADFAKLLAAADDIARVFFTFGGLCGLRTQEILRLQWSDVNWPESVIQIRADVSKTRVRRLAPLTSPAQAWLDEYKHRAGLVIPVKGSHDYHVHKACDETEVAWRPNALRHSFITYRLASLKDPVRVAFECGNSVRIIQRHYDRVVTESQGRAWFAILPETAANVLPMVKASA